MVPAAGLDPAPTVTNADVLDRVLADVCAYALYVNGVELRSYQTAPARAIVESVVQGLGLTFVVAMSRQSGKNETQAQVESYLLAIYSQLNCEMVKASPTFKPQVENAMRRLQRNLENSALFRTLWRKESGYIFRIGKARIYFFSAHGESNVVGATASHLLEADEAQDIEPAKWDKDFLPMAASTNATRVFWGTVWTSLTLLAREQRAALKEQALDGRRRVFMADATEVGIVVPAYAKFVEGVVRKMGRQHPLVKTQYFLEEIDAEGGMFPPARRALMHGNHVRLKMREAGKVYAFLLDVAGEDEDAEGQEVRDREPRKDSTVLTIVEVDLTSLADVVLRAPTYRVVQRFYWTGTKHTALYGRIKSLADEWRPIYLVGDATGVGAGLVSFLTSALGEHVVIPYVFGPKTKSDLGYGFMAVIDSGRFKDWKLPAEGDPDYGTADERSLMEMQIANVQYEVLPGPGKLMRWAVPDLLRDPNTGELVHDDLAVSASLCWVLDAQVWPVGDEYTFVRGQDPLTEMDKADW